MALCMQMAASGKLRSQIHYFKLLSVVDTTFSPCLTNMASVVTFVLKA